ncbi:hypothetical protein MP638_006519, partial [Amoeboaphelidium occidentale]
RTFRAHTNKVYSFIVTNDSRMISSAYDDMIIVWDLQSALILKRVWLRASNTLVRSISLQNDQLYIAGYDMKLRCVDLVTDRVVTIFGYGVPVVVILVNGDFLYIGKQSPTEQLEQIYTPSSSLSLSFNGHSDSIYALFHSESLLYSGSADTTIKCWNVQNGALIRTFQGYSDAVYALNV